MFTRTTAEATAIRKNITNYFWCRPKCVPLLSTGSQSTARLRSTCRTSSGFRHRWYSNVKRGGNSDEQKRGGLWFGGRFSVPPPPPSLPGMEKKYIPRKHGPRSNDDTKYSCNARGDRRLEGRIFVEQWIVDICSTVLINPNPNPNPREQKNLQSIAL